MAEEAAKRPRGRPTGTKTVSAEIAKTVRLRPEEDRLLTGLKEKWGCSEAAAFRRLVQEAAERYGVK